MRKGLYALTIAGLLSVGLLAQQGGGAFVPSFNYDISGVWTFTGVPKINLTGLLLGNGSSTAASAVTTSAGIASALSDETGTGAVVLGTAPTVNGAVGTVALEVVAATNVITAAECGSTFVLSHATEFVSTLPAPSAGCRFVFIVGAAPSSASYTVVTASSANIIKGLQNSVAGDAGDSGTADDTITFVDSQAVAGDKVEVVSDGTSWFAYGISKVAAAITFTQAS